MAALGQAIREFPLRFQVPATCALLKVGSHRVSHCICRPCGKATRTIASAKIVLWTMHRVPELFSKASVKDTAKTYRSLSVVRKKRLYDIKTDQNDRNGRESLLIWRMYWLRKAESMRRPFDRAREQ